MTNEPMDAETAYWKLLEAINNDEGSLTEAGVEKALAPLFERIGALERQNTDLAFALMRFRSAYETGRNEPLVIAYETSTPLFQVQTVNH